MMRHTSTPREIRQVKVLVLVLVTCFLMLGISLWLISRAHAHDHARPGLDKWFDALKSGKGPCCSSGDGEVVTDVDWESERGHYRVRLGEQWLDVPDDAVVTAPNLAGQTMVWPLRAPGSISIRCFMPGSMT